MATRSLIVVALLTVATAQRYNFQYDNDFYNQNLNFQARNPSPPRTVSTPRGTLFTNRFLDETEKHTTVNEYEDTSAAATHQQSLLEKYLDGNVKFTTKVYQKMLNGNSESFVVSPISAQLNLALMQYGGTGRTANELATALNLPSNKTQLLQTIIELTPLLQDGDQYALHLANKIYYSRKDFKFNDVYKDAAKFNFKSDFEDIDFNNGVQAANNMNAWVNQKTNGKIKHLIDANGLNNRTSLVLLNAIFFKGKWIYDFDTQFTQPRDFHINKVTSKKVQTMQMTVHLNFYNSTKLHAAFVELPYVGKNITMTIVLPHEIDGLENVERNLAEYLVQQPYKEEDVHVRLPKFNLTTSVDFADILKSLGVIDAFDDKYADFTELSRKKPIKIDQVVQKAALELDERGTIATAATYTIAAIPISALFVPPPLPKKLEVNHPFIYYIKSPAGILFVGRYVK